MSRRSVRVPPSETSVMARRHRFIVAAMRSRILPLLVLTAGSLTLHGQTTVGAGPSADQKLAIEKKLTELASRVDALRAKKADRALVADGDIYRKAAAYILRFPEEFAKPDYVAHTMSVLDTGLARAKELEAGAPSWPKRKGHVIRAYVSRVDGSVQPYGLTIPESYDGSRPMRLDVWQHGTNRALNEVAFIVQQESDKAVPVAQSYLQLEPLGRTNVSYRWAGEAD